MFFTPRTRLHWVLLTVFTAALLVVLYLSNRKLVYGPEQLPAPVAGLSTPGSAAAGASVTEMEAFANGAGVGSAASWWKLAPQISPDAAAKIVRPAHAVPSYADRVNRVFPIEQTVAGGTNNVLNARGALGIGGNTRVTFALPDGRRIAGEVKLAQREDDGRLLLGGRLDDGGSFSLARLNDGAVVGTILPGGPVDYAYVLERGTDGEVYLLEKDRDTVLCVSMTRMVKGGGQGQSGAVVADGAAAEAPVGDSLDDTPVSAAPVGSAIPQSDVAAVIFIDFDGETVTDSSWNGGVTFTVANSGLTSTQISRVVSRVQEDYLPFKIQVTTDPDVYAAAPVGKRMRCIVTTSTSWWSGDGGGVAYTNSWSNAGYSRSTTVPCWAISTRLGNDSKSIADAVSHEVGHTLGLSHDGIVGGADSYYDGNETEVPSWAPLMGNSYSVTLSQWSRGEYTKGGVAANNTEDDLFIIGSIKNHTGRKDDDVSSVSTSAMALLAARTTTVNKSGIIERTGDIDAYMFATSGAVSFALAQASLDDLPNLDAKFTIKDFDGNTVASADPANSIYPTISVTLPAGVYVLQITGASKGTGVADGYSNYGSLGAYRITGTVATTSAFVPRVGGWLNNTAQVGVAFNYQIQSAGNPTSFTASNLPPGLSLNATTGVISGTPTMAGKYTVGIRAINAKGTSTLRNAVFNFLADTYPSAVDAPSLTFTSGGDAPWEIVDDQTQVGTSSARAGDIGRLSTSWIETTLPGPGVLTFWWKVSSEADNDYLRYKADGVTYASISGDTEWAQVSRTITGARTVRWSYEKDGITNSSSDTAWLDGITFVMTPAITSATAARVVVGSTFSYTITSDQPVEGATVTGLPDGLYFDETTGVISGTPTTAGTFSVTLATSNVAGSSTKTLSLTVRTPYQAWAEERGIQITGSTADWSLADADGDGRSNLMEYAFASDPMSRDVTPVAAVSTSMSDSSALPVLAISFAIPPDRTGMRYIVEVSSDLVTWQRGHAFGEGATNAENLPTYVTSDVIKTDGTRQLSVSDAAPSVSDKRRFIRLRVELVGN